MNLYIKNNQVKPINQIVLIKDGMQIFNPTENMIIENGWVKYEAPELTEKEQQLIESEKARQELQNSDYKIIKCMECYLCGEELPYDIEMLHEERNKQRDIVNGYQES